MSSLADYGTLNRIRKNNVSLPKTDEVLHRTGGAKVLFVLDLRSDFHQITTMNEDINQIALNTIFGQFPYFVLPLGAFNVPTTFQLVMYEIFYGFSD